MTLFPESPGAKGKKKEHLMRGAHPKLGGRETTAPRPVTHLILPPEHCCTDCPAQRLLSRGSPSTREKLRDTSDRTTFTRLSQRLFRRHDVLPAAREREGAYWETARALSIPTP